MNEAESFAAELEAFKAAREAGTHRKPKADFFLEQRVIAQGADKNLRTGAGPCDICGSMDVSVGRGARLECNSCFSTLTVYD